MTLPSLFLSHGAPTLPLTDTPARAFLRELGDRLPAPKAILVVSAHWETAVPTVSAVDLNDTIHDFHGFPPPLYALRYPAPGSPSVAERVSELLRAGGLDCRIDRSRGLDHGAWVPLLLMYPQAEIPVLQLSVQPHLGPEHHLRMGRLLAPLRQQGVLIVGSGSLTHDLSEFRGHGPNDPAPDWVNAFADWFQTALTAGRADDLIDYRRQAPFRSRTTRAKSISCPCTPPWGPRAKTRGPSGCTPVRPTASCAWTFTPLQRRTKPSACDRASRTPAQQLPSCSDLARARGRHFEQGGPVAAGISELLRASGFEMTASFKPPADVPRCK
jgi:4,5-DOPA dioxygenase extradiol